jgi:hypothetical protein
MQTSFSAGELAPSLHSHADLAKYRTGLALCQNWFVLAQGGITTRAGLEYISEIIDSSSAARLIPFQFNTEQAYALLFTDQAMRVIRNGGMVLETNQNITGATQADPVVVTITGHGYSNDDDVFIDGVVGMTELNGRFFRVANVTANTFELTDYAGNDIDGTGFTAYSSGGTAGRVFTINPPYVGADLFRIKYTQSADVMTLTHPDYTQRELTRTGHASWQMTLLTFAADISPPSAGFSITYQGTATGSDAKQYRYVVTSVNDAGEESVASGIQSTSGTEDAIAETYGPQISWTTVAGAAYYNVYKEFSLNSGIFGWIGEADEDGSPSFTDYNYGPDMSVTPPIAKNPFNASDNFPSCATYHQQRQMFAATNNNPQTVWGTRTADFDNMDTSRPSRADDAMEATLVSRQVNEIRHLLSLGELIVFTSGGEWQLEGDQDGILTPSNLNFRAQGYRGASHVPPVVIGEAALFVQEKGARVRDLRYTFEDDKFTGNDLTILARHFFEGYEIVDWAFAQEPHSIVWAVRDDGVMLSLTYLQEHNVFAWAQHTTDGEFESVCAVSEGDQDVIYAIVKRTINGSTVRNVERMKERNFTTIEDAFCVDAGLTYTGESDVISGATQADPVVITATAHGRSNGDVIRIADVVGMTELNGNQYKVANATANTFELTDLLDQDVDGTGFTAYSSGGTAQFATTSITNLHHLEGETVVALADGNVVENLTVSAGEITLPNAASVVHVGLGYNCDFETLEVSFQGDVVQSRKKQVSRVALRVLESRGLSAGKDVNNLYEIRARTPAMGYDDIPSKTEEQRLGIAPGWSDYGQIYVRQGYPLPATVLAIIPEIEVSG